MPITDNTNPFPSTGGETGQAPEGGGTTSGTTPPASLSMLDLSSITVGGQPVYTVTKDNEYVWAKPTEARFYLDDNKWLKNQYSDILSNTTPVRREATVRPDVTPPNNLSCTFSNDADDDCYFTSKVFHEDVITLNNVKSFADPSHWCTTSFRFVDNIDETNYNWKLNRQAALESDAFELIEDEGSSEYFKFAKVRPYVTESTVFDNVLGEFVCWMGRYDDGSYTFYLDLPIKEEYISEGYYATVQIYHITSTGAVNSLINYTNVALDSGRLKYDDIKLGTERGHVFVKIYVGTYNNANHLAFYCLV